MLISLASCAAPEKEIQKKEGQTVMSDESGNSEETTAASETAALQANAVSSDLPAFKSYKEIKLDISALFVDPEKECNVLDIKKTGGKYLLLAGLMSGSHITEFDILSFENGQTSPQISKIVPKDLSYDFLAKAKDAKSEYVKAQIEKDGEFKVDYYITASLGDDGKVYALKSITAYSMPGKDEKIKIDKSTAVSVFDAGGNAEDTILKITAEGAYYDKVIKTSSGVVLTGSEDNKNVCVKVGEDGGLSSKEIEKDTKDYFITDPAGTLCQVLTGSSDHAGFYIRYYDAGLNVIKTEEVPGGYVSNNSKISFSSEDTIVYSEDNRISSYNLKEKNGKELYASLQDRFRYVLLDENEDIYTLYYGEEDHRLVFSVLKSSEVDAPAPAVSPDEPYFIEISEDETKDIKDIDRDTIIAMNPEDPFLPTIEEGPGVSLIRTVYGSYSDMKVTSPKEALLSLYQVRSLTGIKDPSKELKFAKSVVSGLTGETTYVFSFVYKGIDAPNVSISVHAKADGSTSMLQNGFEGYDLFEKTGTKAAVSAEDAKAVISAKGAEATDEPELIIYYNYEKHEAVLVYSVHSSGMIYLIDAGSGDIYMEESTIYT